MKKILILILTSFLNFNLPAQIGVKIGFNQSIVTSHGNSEIGESNNLITGAQGGFVLKKPLSKKIDLLAEINYEIRGSKSMKNFSFNFPLSISVADSFTTVNSTVNRTEEVSASHIYINIPILFAFGSKKLKFYLGPNMAWVLKATSEHNYITAINYTGNTTTNQQDYNINLLDEESLSDLYGPSTSEKGKYLKAIDFGINVGALFYFRKNIFFDFRINHGLIDMTNNAYDLSIHIDDNFMFPERKDVDRNFSMQLSVGYFF